jgi:hypothetical protein
MFLFSWRGVIVVLVGFVAYGLMFVYPRWGAWYDDHETVVFVLAGIGVLAWSFLRKSSRSRGH